VMETRLGGRWYELAEDGTQTNVGKIIGRPLTSPKRFVMTWDINSQWKADTTVSSEVEVRFIVEGANATRVELEHRKFEQMGAEAGEKMRNVGQTSIAKYMARHRRPPSQGWKTFLRNHADGIASMDLFVVPTISFRLLYGLLILWHGRRQILWLGLTAHPTSEWMARQLTEACGWERTPEYLVRDRDSVYGEIFTRRLRAMGIRDRPIAPRSPWQNGHTERLIGSLRRECLDHVVVFNEQHLRQLLLLYKDYYNRARSHLSLNKDAPVPRAIEPVGRIHASPILGGLHHLYVRI
jgi:transposase InsO family protein